MKKLCTLIMAALGLTSACSQKNYVDTDVSGFAALAAEADVVVLDVRTAEEYAEGHIANALNIDVRQDGFADKAKAALPAGCRVGVYCRSGRRSADAAQLLAAEGIAATNLQGGILAWKDSGMPVEAGGYETDIFADKGGKLISIHALMHASIRIDYGGRVIMVDPVGRLGERTVDYAAMPKADYILVTHEHADHYDKETIRMLSDSGTVVITNRRCADMLGYGTALANGDTMHLADDVKVEAVPAYNTTQGHLQFHPKGRDNGFVLTLGQVRIYIAGDTEDIPEMNNLKDIDIAFLPCNQPYTMTVEQLVKAARTVRPQVLFPYHYGATELDSVPTRLKPDGVEVRNRHYE